MSKSPRLDAGGFPYRVIVADGRSFLLASLLSAVLLLSVFAVVQAQEGRTPAARPARWSDAATWPERRVLRAGDTITIAAGKDVVLDDRVPWTVSRLRV